MLQPAPKPDVAIDSADDDAGDENLEAGEGRGRGEAMEEGVNAGENVFLFDLDEDAFGGGEWKWRAAIWFGITGTAQWY